MARDSFQDVSLLLTDLGSAEEAAREAQARAAKLAADGEVDDVEAARSAALAAEQELAESRNRLFDAVYSELREVASRVRHAHSPLGATSLVHQAYTRLVRNEWAMDSPNREEFYQRAGRVLQRTLVDQVRKTRSLKAGGGLQRLPIDERIEQLESGLDGSNLLDIEDVLTRLDVEDPVGASIVRLHFFGCLSLKDIAAALEMGERTVLRRWKSARAWLHEALRPS